LELIAVRVIEKLQAMFGQRFAGAVEDIDRAAKKAGVKWYFIEDESPTAAQQSPQSLRFLEQVKW
jgi:hypothetical protein